MAPQQLKVDRSLQDENFSNWRLGDQFVTSASSASFISGLAVADTGSTNDYLHTRASLCHNHLHVCGEGVYVFTSPNQGSVTLLEAMPCPTASPRFLLHEVATMAVPALPAGTCRAEGTCPADCSVVLVQPALPPTAQANGTQGSTGAAGMSSGQLLLISCGQGDLSLCSTRASSGGHAAVSPAVFPLREQAPLVGVRPFKLEAAYMLKPGTIRCVLWSIRSRTAQLPAACETYLVTLETSDSTHAPTTAPQITDVRQMCTTSLPPHCVTCDPESDSVMLGCDPTELDVKPDATQQPVAPPTPPAAAGGADAEVEHIECRPPWARDDAARGMASHGHTSNGVMCDDDDDMDPRTVAEAAARLAQYTSETLQGPLPEAQWTDVFKEGGPEDVNADSGCEVLVWRAGRSRQAQGGDVPQDTAAGQGEAAWSLSCGAHKVLSADTPGLLAVTDDVDMCVLQVGWAPSDASSPGGAAAPHARRVPLVRHIATVPALAYVAAGKTQRKHILIGTPPSLSPECPCSAVLVETSKYLYVYGQVAPGRHYGNQQIVDMALDPGERVMGARLMTGSRWTGPLTDGHKGAVVLVLTQRRLLDFALGAGA